MDSSSDKRPDRLGVESDMIKLYGSDPLKKHSPSGSGPKVWEYVDSISESLNLKAVKVQYANDETTAIFYDYINKSIYLQRSAAIVKLYPLNN